MQKPYNLADLIKRWGREELTVEQTIGQILVWLTLLVERIDRLESAQRGQQVKPGGVKE